MKLLSQVRLLVFSRIIADSRHVDQTHMSLAQCGAGFRRTLFLLYSFIPNRSHPAGNLSGYQAGLCASSETQPFGVVDDGRSLGTVATSITSAPASSSSARASSGV